MVDQEHGFQDGVKEEAVTLLDLSNNIAWINQSVLINQDDQIGT